MSMSDEFFPTPAQVARERERTVDPHNWVDCEECNGGGVIDYGEGPDERLVTCDDCSGSGGYEWECAECGNTVQVDGYDCLACETADALPAQGFDHAAIAKSIAAALNQGVQS